MSDRAARMTPPEPTMSDRAVRTRAEGGLSNWSATVTVRRELHDPAAAFALSIGREAVDE